MKRVFVRKLTEVKENENVHGEGFLFCADEYFFK